jgi:curved DNA-binding protein CbpA
MSSGDHVDLEPERQREILELEAKLETANLFEVLGVTNGAGVETVRAAFREMSRKYHPDRFFSKNLGEFAGKIDRIFKKLVEANQTLTDDARRKAYLENNPFVRAAVRAASRYSSGSSASHRVAEPKTEQELARDEERRARLARHPYLRKAGKLQELLSRAKSAIDKKEFSQAFTFLSQAAEADPLNVEVKTLLTEVRKQNDRQRAENSFKHGTEALDRGDDTLALQALKTAANGGHFVAAYKVALLLEAHRGDLREITTYAQKAVEGDPGNAVYRVLLGRLLEAGGMKAMAKKHFDEAVRLDPDHPDVKKYAKKRWPF